MEVYIKEAEKNDRIIKAIIKNVEDVIGGSYEEIYFNWKNKMYHDADKDNIYL